MRNLAFLLLCMAAPCCCRPTGSVLMAVSAQGWVVETMGSRKEAQRAIHNKPPNGLDHRDGMHVKGGAGNPQQLHGLGLQIAQSGPVFVYFGPQSGYCLHTWSPGIVSLRDAFKPYRLANSESRATGEPEITRPRIQALSTHAPSSTMQQSMSSLN